MLVGRKCITLEYIINFIGSLSSETDSLTSDDRTSPSACLEVHFVKRIKSCAYLVDRHKIRYDLHHIVDSVCQVFV